MTVGFIWGIFYFQEESWYGGYVQSTVTIIPLLFGLIVFLISRADGDESHQQQLRKMDELNDDKIQILKDGFQSQIDALMESTNKQIENYQTETSKHIKAIQESTQEQIQSNREHTEAVVKRLEENSTLLAEILMRQLEEALEEFQGRLNQANAEMENLKGWKLFRSRDQRQKQLRQQEVKINIITKGYNYLMEKYKMIKEAFNS